MAAVCRGGHVTYSVFLSRSSRVVFADGSVVDQASVTEAVSRLKEQGFVPGSLHLCHARPCPAFVAKALATFLLGGWLVLLNERWGEYERSAAQKRFGILPSVGADSIVRDVAQAKLGSGGGLIACTSGSTGQAKFVVLSLAQMLVAAAAYNRRLGIQSGHRWLGVLPLTHIAGLAVLFRSWLAGGVCQLRAPVRTGALADLVRQTSPDFVSIVPAQLPDNPGMLSNATIWIVGGDLLSEVQKKVLRPLGRRALVSYGMSETFGGVAFASAPDFEAYALLPGWQMSVAQDGELVLDGSVAFKGCLNESGVLERSSGTRFCTGDRVTQLGQAGFAYQGRQTAMVKVKGFGVNLTEVAQVIQGIDGVESVELFLVKHEQKLKAVLTLTAATQPETVRRVCRQKLAAYKVPALWELLVEP